MRENLILRNTNINDLDFVLYSENLDENLPYIGNWNRDGHLSSLSDSSILHKIIEVEEIAIGYVIVKEYYDKKIIEIKRLVINEKNKGYGKIVLKKLLENYFEKENSERIWLDVRIDNERAQHLYKSVGFVEEGILRNAVYINGRFETIKVLSILKEEYFSLIKK